jgi:hypothetical protein
MHVTAFAVDIDCTLTDRRLLLDLDAISVLRQLESKGIKIIIATGRNFSITRALVGYLGTCGLMVAENGGLVGIYPNTRIILGDPEQSRKGLEVLKKELGEDAISLLDTPCRLVDVVLEPKFDLKLGNDILAGHNVRARLVHSGVAYHILDSNVDKAKGLSEICRMGHVDLDSLVAVGDSYNDVEMIESAGYGIAVANAPDELKSKADHVCREEFGKGFVEAVNHALKRLGSA